MEYYYVGGIVCRLVNTLLRSRWLFLPPSPWTYRTLYLEFQNLSVPWSRENLSILKFYGIRDHNPR